MDLSTNKTIFFFRALILIFMLGALVGCEGDDGAPGAQGPPGPPGSSLADLSTLSFEQQATLGTVSIQEGSVAVSITSPPVVTFTLIDSFGRPVLGLDSIVAGGENNVIRFTLARLVDANPDYWSSYLINAGVGSYDSPRTGGTLVSNGDGSYIYTWAYDVGADANFNPADTHRLASQIGDSDLGFEPSNFFMDFVPNGNTVTLSRNVATTASCNECHDPLNIHGRRRLVGYCVTCHTSELAEGEGEMSFMIHKLHAAGDFEVLDDAVSYAELTYPQELLNCRKCHNGADAETPQGDNWQTVQNAKICFTSCHAVPDSIPAFHSPTTASCAACHGTAVAAALDIDAIHTTPNATENNPNLLPGQRNIEYQLDSAAISDGNLEIIFRILSDGTAINLTSLPADLVAGDRWPAFLFAYALGIQDGIAEPSDFNNIVNSAGQPESADLGDLVDGIGGSMACVDGTCTATMTDPFPVDAMMRTVGLQGYFRQDLDNDDAYDVSLHSQSTVVT
ncbi:MAG: hypothetical protein JRE18_05095, partial [Deltaproteobacteria bacterium]|nr:hypothetical protein [Deltaproteobacteria bacterium]